MHNAVRAENVVVPVRVTRKFDEPAVTRAIPPVVPRAEFASTLTVTTPAPKVPDTRGRGVPDVPLGLLEEPELPPQPGIEPKAPPITAALQAWAQKALLVSIDDSPAFVDLERSSCDLKTAVRR